MLQLLHIENIAVIEKADIEFAGGLNVLTGETGAGKSIVIDALSAVTGCRVSRELVRSGADAASASAVFTAEGAALRWCAENDLAPEDGEDIFIQRRITSDGKSSCRVNGAPVSAAQLRELGMHLVDIHGQNDGRRLLNEASHRDYLDGFGGLFTALEEYGAAYAEYKSKQREIDAISMDESEKERRLDMLKAQIEELKGADIKAGELARIKERCELLKNASKLTDALDEAFFALYGGERSDGAVALIGEAEGAVSGASRYADMLTGVAEKLRDLRYSAQDAAEELRDLRGGLDFSPGELDELEARISRLGRILRKYGGSEEDAIAYLENAENELNDIEFSSDRLIKLEKELDELRKKALKSGGELSEKRKAAAKRLKARITEELGQLNMSGVRFEVNITPVEAEDGLTAHGCDEVCFLMSANAGEEPGRISRIASGGELSRIMLALKNVLSENEDIAVMVFDEIDTGVSGIAAQRVGEKLSDLAASRQVLCVTHLPQIAAMADVHFEISKTEKGGRTYTSVARLDKDGCVGELSRLIGGDNVTDKTLAAARELLSGAEKYRKTRALKTAGL